MSSIPHREGQLNNNTMPPLVFHIPIKVTWGGGLDMKLDGVMCELQVLTFINPLSHV